MKERIEIIITDDQLAVRQGLAAVLKDENIFTIAQAANGKELIRLLEVDKLSPHVIMLDIEMPVMDGNATLAYLKKHFPLAKVIILSMFANSSLVNDFKAKGANAYLTKNTDIRQIAETIKNVHYLAGYSNISTKIKSAFTKREVQIIPLMLAGKTSKQIAGILGLAEKTVEANRNRLYEKTQTANASQFSSYCTKEGMMFLESKNAVTQNV